MIYQLSNIVEDVRNLMDLSDNDGELMEIGDSGAKTIADMVRATIEQAARFVMKAAPVQLIDNADTFNGQEHLFWNEDGTTGYILLPDSFMRLVQFKMSDWSKPVFSAITTNHPAYELQSSGVKGLMGNPSKPVAAVVARNSGLKLEFYSCKNNQATVEADYYLPYPTLTCDGIDISEACYVAVVHMVASLIYAIIGEADKSANMSALAKSILES